MEVVERKPLPPTVAYFIRKLLRQNLDQLSPREALGNSLQADHLSNLNAVLESLYTEVQEANSVVRQLEQLTLSHQVLSSQGTRYHQELKVKEAEIFQLIGFQPRQTMHEGAILIVDSAFDSCQLLAEAFMQQGYFVCSAGAGKPALNLIANSLPDLILLDATLPDLDSYAVCKQLQSHSMTRDIPIIFICPSDDVQAKVKAFNVGCVDCMTKPFDAEEVLVRIGHQLKLRTLQKRLEEQNVRLQQKIQDCTQAEDRYRSIFEDSVIGIFQSAPEGHFLRVNTALVQIYGYASSNDLLNSISDIGQQLYVKPQRRLEFVTRMLQHGRVIDFETQVYRKDRSIIWIAEDVRVVKDSKDKTLYYEGAVRDITARKQTQEKLLRYLS
jgi:adenylate cyclase